MATTMKGLLKGLRYITQIFGESLIVFSINMKRSLLFPVSQVNIWRDDIHSIADEEKEQEMQIGFPTDVKHVAHIGSDGPATTPSWVQSCIRTFIPTFVHISIHRYTHHHHCLFGKKTTDE